MNGKIFDSRKIVTCAFLASVLILATTLSVHAQQDSHPANAMWVEPSSITFTPENATIGQKFNITVWLNISNIQFYSYSIGLKYNRTQLKALRGDFTKDFTAGHDTQTAGPIIDTSYLGNGSVLVTESCKGEDYIQGPKLGTLIWVEFEIVTVPAEGETLTSVIDITSCYPGDTWVMDSDLNYVELNGFNATYSFIPEFTVLFMLVTMMLTSLAVALKMRIKRKL